MKKTILIFSFAFALGYGSCFLPSYFNSKDCKETIQVALAIPKTAINNDYGKIKAKVLAMETTNVISQDSTKRKRWLKNLFKKNK